MKSLIQRRGRWFLILGVPLSLIVTFGILALVYSIIFNPTDILAEIIGGGIAFVFGLMMFLLVAFLIGRSRLKGFVGDLIKSL